MVLNDRSLTSLKDGLSNSLNLTNQDFYVRLVDKKNKENNSILAGRSFSLPRFSSHAHFDFPPFLRPATQAMALPAPLAPVVCKLINANPQLNHPNLQKKIIILRLNSVPESLISTIQGLN